MTKHKLIAFFAIALLLGGLQTEAAASSYWFLVRTDGIYKAHGPFPTHEMCMIAGHDLDWRDPRFMNAEQQAAHERLEAAEQARREAAIDKAIREQKPAKDGTVRLEISPCSVEYIDAKTRALVGVVSSCLSMVSFIDILTGCLKDE